MKALACVVAVGMVGCTDDPPPPAGYDAFVHAGDVITFVNLPAEHDADLEAILAGETPTGYGWIAITIPTDRLGATIHLDEADGGTSFSDGYRDTCNPALEDFSPCWLYEHYEAGEPGVSGTISLSLVDDFASGGIDVTWSGLTDRYGAPLQQLTRNYQAGIGKPFTVR